MAIVQDPTSITYTLQPEVASRMMLISRDVVDSGNGSVSVNFGASIIPHSTTYEVDVNKNKIGIYEEKDLQRFDLTSDELMSLFGIWCTLIDGTGIALGELISNFADQAIQQSTGFTGTITTQQVNIPAILAAQAAAQLAAQQAAIAAQDAANQAANATAQQTS